MSEHPRESGGDAEREDERSGAEERIRVLLADDPDILAGGLRALLEVAGDIAAADVMPEAQQDQAARYEKLSSREREVLQLVAEGWTNQDIANHLGLSIKTVQSHRAAVMDKLELRDVTHLVRYAVRHGLVDPE